MVVPGEEQNGSMSDILYLFIQLYARPSDTGEVRDGALLVSVFYSPDDVVRSFDVLQVRDPARPLFDVQIRFR